MSKKLKTTTIARFDNLINEEADLLTLNTAQQKYSTLINDDADQIEASNVDINKKITTGLNSFWSKDKDIAEVDINLQLNLKFTPQFGVGSFSNKPILVDFRPSFLDHLELPYLLTKEGESAFGIHIQKNINVFFQVNSSIPVDFNFRHICIFHGKGSQVALQLPAMSLLEDTQPLVPFGTTSGPPLGPTTFEIAKMALESYIMQSGHIEIPRIIISGGHPLAVLKKDLEIDDGVKDWVMIKELTLSLDKSIFDGVDKALLNAVRADEGGKYVRWYYNERKKFKFDIEDPNLISKEQIYDALLQEIVSEDLLSDLIVAEDGSGVLFCYFNPSVNTNNHSTEKNNNYMYNSISPEFIVPIHNENRSLVRKFLFHPKITSKSKSNVISLPVTNSRSILLQKETPSAENTQETENDIWSIIAVVWILPDGPLLNSHHNPLSSIYDSLTIGIDELGRQVIQSGAFGSGQLEICSIDSDGWRLVKYDGEWRRVDEHECLIFDDYDRDILLTRRLHAPPPRNIDGSPQPKVIPTLNSNFRLPIAIAEAIISDHSMFPVRRMKTGDYIDAAGWKISPIDGKRIDSNNFEVQTDPETLWRWWDLSILPSSSNGSFSSPIPNRLRRKVPPAYSSWVQPKKSTAANEDVLITGAHAELAAEWVLCSAEGWRVIPMKLDDEEENDGTTSISKFNQTYETAFDGSQWRLSTKLGKPINRSYSSKGKLILEVDNVKFDWRGRFLDEDGNPMDESGNPLVLDAYGNRIIQYVPINIGAKVIDSVDKVQPSSVMEDIVIDDWGFWIEYREPQHLLHRKFEKELLESKRYNKNDYYRSSMDNFFMRHMLKARDGEDSSNDFRLSRGNEALNDEDKRKLPKSVVRLNQGGDEFFEGNEFEIGFRPNNIVDDADEVYLSIYDRRDLKFENEHIKGFLNDSIDNEEKLWGGTTQEVENQLTAGFRNASSHQLGRPYGLNAAFEEVRVLPKPPTPPGSSIAPLAESRHPILAVRFEDDYQPFQFGSNGDLLSIESAPAADHGNLQASGMKQIRGYYHRIARPGEKDLQLSIRADTAPPLNASVVSAQFPATIAKKLMPSSQQHLNLNFLDLDADDSPEFIQQFYNVGKGDSVVKVGAFKRWHLSKVKYDDEGENAIKTYRDKPHFEFDSFRHPARPKDWGLRKKIQIAEDPAPPAPKLIENNILEDSLPHSFVEPSLEDVPSRSPTPPAVQPRNIPIKELIYFDNLLDGQPAANEIIDHSIPYPPRVRATQPEVLDLEFINEVPFWPKPSTNVLYGSSLGKRTGGSISAAGSSFPQSELILSPPPSLRSSELRAAVLDMIENDNFDEEAISDNDGDIPIELEVPWVPEYDVAVSEVATTLDFDPNDDVGSRIESYYSDEHPPVLKEKHHPEELRNLLALGYFCGILDSIDRSFRMRRWRLEHGLFRLSNRRPVVNYTIRVASCRLLLMLINFMKLKTLRDIFQLFYNKSIARRLHLRALVLEKSAIVLQHFHETIHQHRRRAHKKLCAAAILFSLLNRIILRTQAASFIHPVSAAVKLFPKIPVIWLTVLYPAPVINSNCRPPRLFNRSIDQNRRLRLMLYLLKELYEQYMSGYAGMPLPQLFLRLSALLRRVEDVNGVDILPSTDIPRIVNNRKEHQLLLENDRSFDWIYGGRPNLTEMMEKLVSNDQINFELLAEDNIIYDTNMDYSLVESPSLRGYIQSNIEMDDSIDVKNKNSVNNSASNILPTHEFQGPSRRVEAAFGSRFSSELSPENRFFGSSSPIITNYLYDSEDDEYVENRDFDHLDERKRERVAPFRRLTNKNPLTFHPVTELYTGDTDDSDNGAAEGYFPINGVGGGRAGKNKIFVNDEADSDGTENGLDESGNDEKDWVVNEKGERIKKKKNKLRKNKLGKHKFGQNATGDFIEIEEVDDFEDSYDENPLKGSNKIILPPLSKKGAFKRPAVNRPKNNLSGLLSDNDENNSSDFEITDYVDINKQHLNEKKKLTPFEEMESLNINPYLSWMHGANLHEESQDDSDRDENGKRLLLPVNREGKINVQQLSKRSNRDKERAYGNYTLGTNHITVPARHGDVLRFVSGVTSDGNIVSGVPVVSIMVGGKCIDLPLIKAKPRSSFINSEAYKKRQERIKQLGGGFASNYDPTSSRFHALIDDINGDDFNGDSKINNAINCKMADGTLVIGGVPIHANAILGYDSNTGAPIIDPDAINGLDPNTGMPRIKNSFVKLINKPSKRGVMINRTKNDRSNNKQNPFYNPSSSNLNGYLDGLQLDINHDHGSDYLEKNNDSKTVANNINGEVDSSFKGVSSPFAELQSLIFILASVRVINIGSASDDLIIGGMDDNQDIQVRYEWLIKKWKRHNWSNVPISLGSYFTEPVITGIRPIKSLQSILDRIFKGSNKNNTIFDFQRRPLGSVDDEVFKSKPLLFSKISSHFSWLVSHPVELPIRAACKDSEMRALYMWSVLRAAYMTLQKPIVSFGVNLRLIMENFILSETPTIRKAEEHDKILNLSFLKDLKNDFLPLGDWPGPSEALAAQIEFPGTDLAFKFNPNVARAQIQSQGVLTSFVSQLDVSIEQLEVKYMTVNEDDDLNSGLWRTKMEYCQKPHHIINDKDILSLYDWVVYDSKKTLSAVVFQSLKDSKNQGITAKSSHIIAQDFVRKNFDAPHPSLFNFMYMIANNIDKKPLVFPLDYYEARRLQNEEQSRGRNIRLRQIELSNKIKETAFIEHQNIPHTIQKIDLFENKPKKSPPPPPPPPTKSNNQNNSLFNKKLSFPSPLQSKNQNNPPPPVPVSVKQSASSVNKTAPKAPPVPDAFKAVNKNPPSKPSNPLNVAPVTPITQKVKAPPPPPAKIEIKKNDTITHAKPPPPPKNPL